MTENKNQRHFEVYCLAVKVVISNFPAVDQLLAANAVWQRSESGRTPV